MSNKCPSLLAPKYSPQPSPPPTAVFHPPILTHRTRSKKICLSHTARACLFIRVLYATLARFATCNPVARSLAYRPPPLPVDVPHDLARHVSEGNPVLHPAGPPPPLEGHDCETWAERRQPDLEASAYRRHGPHRGRRGHLRGMRHGTRV